MKRLTLKGKILLWSGIIILIAVILYGFLIYMVYQFNLRGERYFKSLMENSEIDRSLIERLKESDRGGFPKVPGHLTILPPNLFMRVFLTITGGVIAIILITVLGGFLLLRQMLNQIDYITRNVKEIDEKGLHLRINLKGKDPISNMAATFDDMLDKIERAFTSQKQFIQNASHELNTPLTVIKTKIDLLRQKKSIKPGQYKETVDLIDSEIMRLSRITEELLMLSDLEDNNKQERQTSIDLKAVLQRILKLYENRVDSRDLKLKSGFKGPMKIKGNPVQIEQLIFNLLDNAVKYSDSGGYLKINIEGDRAKGKIFLNINNRTSAIKKEDIPHIFERFYRSVKKQDTKSFGLGLSISKKIVEKHEGSIEVRFDQERKEVTFVITFPILAQDSI